MKANERRKEKQNLKRAKGITEKEITRFYFIFPLLFLIVAFGFNLVTPYLVTQIVAISGWTAGLLGVILNLFGMNAYTSGPLLVLNKFSITVVGECTGLYEMLIFLAALLAFPAKFNKKLFGFLLSIPILYIINILRMVFIIVVGNWHPKTFTFFHIYFWQVAGILIVGGMWLFWIEKIVKYERKSGYIYC